MKINWLIGNFWKIEKRGEIILGLKNSKSIDWDCETLDRDSMIKRRKKGKLSNDKTSDEINWRSSIKPNKKIR